jgi:hypothetical protein
VKSDDGRMRDLPHYASLLQKTVASLAAGEFGGEKLDGNDARDQRVEGAGHAAIGADPDYFQDFVTADLAEVRTSLHGDFLPDKSYSLG